MKAKNTALILIQGIVCTLYNAVLQNEAFAFNRFSVARAQMRQCHVVGTISVLHFPPFLEAHNL